MGFIREYRAAMVVALVLVVVELAAARQTWLWSAFPESASGVVDVLEREIIRPAATPEVVVLGSSRIRDALVPDLFARELGLVDGSVLNLGLTSGTPQDALVLYERNRATLSRAKLVVLGLEDWHFNLGMGANERDRRFGTLEDRLRGFDGPTSRSLVAGYIWRTFDARAQLRRLLNPRSYGNRGRLRVTSDGRLNWRAVELDEGPASVEVRSHIDRFYKSFELRDYTFKVVRRLVELVEQDGGRVVFVEVPLRDAYVDGVMSAHADDWRQCQTAIRSLERFGAVLVSERGSELGIPPEHYYDYGHMTRLGAERFTRLLAARLTALPAKPEAY